LAKLFPMLLDVKWLRPEPEPGVTAMPEAKADYRETVRDYLKKQLENDADAAELLALAETYLASEAVL
jgi:hypothetical protein